ncbi:hypothetical protein [Achromobacter denitrificans]|uniref:hypothetical protein n=1 Tax=Achromobacter denitrificans TaxID=32002 RepID=UPI00158246A8|nr:hypothetical protein [Achromobacter denitrificans]
MTPEQIADANSVLSELVRLEKEFDSLSEQSDPATLDRASVPALQARLTRLKQELKSAAKHETISGRRELPSEFERCFYGPAVQQASANFRLPTNANPFSRSWASELYSSRGDISHFRFSLEKLIQEKTGA